METQCVRIPLKAGKTEQFVTWIESLANRRQELLEAIRREGISFEAIFLERSDAGDALLFYMRANDLVDAQQAFAQSKLPIDLETRNVIAECWDTASATPLQVCLELSA